MSHDTFWASSPIKVLAEWLADWRASSQTSRLGLAVSGGGDSVALLRLMGEIAGQEFAPQLRAKSGPEFAPELGQELGTKLYVYTVDHRLRPEAADEAAWVAELATRHGMVHRSLAWDWNGQGNLSDAARQGRYAALTKACADDGVEHCLLAHTRDDNIETLFLGLFRGAGLDGLAGMRTSFQRGPVCFHRPLLEVSRAALRAELQARGQDWHEDPTNQDLTHDRARVRHLLAGIDLPEARLAQSLAALAATRRDLGAEVVRQLMGRPDASAEGAGISALGMHGPDLTLDLGRLAPMSGEFRRRCIAAALRAVSGQSYAPRASQLMRLVERDWQQNPEPVTLSGCRIWRRGERLYFGREAASLPPPVPSDQSWDGWRADGPHRPGLTLGALGAAGRAQVDASWRQARIPYASLIASPAVWDGPKVIAAALAAPIVADFTMNWSFKRRDLPATFQAALLAH